MVDTTEALLTVGAAGGIAIASDEIKKAALQRSIQAAGERMMASGVTTAMETSTAAAASTGTALVPVSTALTATGGGGALVAAGEGGALAVAGGEVVAGGTAIAGGAAAATFAVPVAIAAAVVAPVIAIAAHEVNKERDKLDAQIASIHSEVDGRNLLFQMQELKPQLEAEGAKKLDAQGAKDNFVNYDLTDKDTVAIIRKKLEEKAQQEQKAIDDNKVAGPAWTDFTEDQSKRRATGDLAKDELARVRAAQGELDPMVKQAEARKSAADQGPPAPDKPAVAATTPIAKPVVHKPALVATEQNREAQAGLAELGYTENAKFAIRSGQQQFDGKEGGKTDQDVASFQKEHKLEVTGKLDDGTRLAINKEVQKLHPGGISVENTETAFLTEKAMSSAARVAETLNGHKQTAVDSNGEAAALHTRAQAKSNDGPSVGA